MKHKDQRLKHNQQNMKNEGQGPQKCDGKQELIGGRKQHTHNNKNPEGKPTFISYEMPGE